MRTLQRVLAHEVLTRLRERQHLVVAPCSGEALCEEVAAIIAGALPAMPQLDEPRSAHLTAKQQGQLGNRSADAAVESLSEKITAQLMSSDHVDDIYADDRVIRRDALRAIRTTLLSYMRGEIDASDDRQAESEFDVRLDSLGYVVASASRRLDNDLLVDALERAAALVGGELLALDRERNTALFQLLGGAAVGRLALEEAITEELTQLVRSDRVALPRLEQVLRIEDGTSDEPGFVEAIERAVEFVRRRTGCYPTCSIVDAHTLVATLTPLSDEAAEHCEGHFESFVVALESELAAIDGGAPPSSLDRGLEAAAQDRASQTRARSSASRSQPARSSPATTRARTSSRSPRRPSAQPRTSGAPPRSRGARPAKKKA
jgi:hypothetical protein